MFEITDSIVSDICIKSPKFVCNRVTSIKRLKTRLKHRYC